MPLLNFGIIALDTNVKLNSEVSRRMRYTADFYCPKGQVTKCEFHLSSKAIEVCLYCHGDKVSIATRYTKNLYCLIPRNTSAKCELQLSSKYKVIEIYLRCHDNKLPRVAKYSKVLIVFRDMCTKYEVHPTSKHKGIYNSI